MKRCIVMVAFLLVSYSLAFGEEPILITVDEGNPPFMFNHGGRAGGLYPDLVYAVFHHMGTPVEITALPWKRALRNADMGLSGIAGIYKTAERLQKYDYSDVLFQEDLVFFSHKDNKGLSGNLNGLKDKRIGAIRGWSYGHEFDTYQQKQFFMVEEAGSDEQNFQKLFFRRIDCAIAIKDSGRRLLSEDRFKNHIIELPGCVATNATHLIFPKIMNQTALLHQFNETLNAMKESGEYQEILHTSLSEFK